MNRSSARNEYSASSGSSPSTSTCLLSTGDTPERSTVWSNIPYATDS